MPYITNEKAYFDFKGFPSEGIFVLLKDLQANKGVFQKGDKVYLRADRVDTAANCVNFTVTGAAGDDIIEDRFTLFFSEIGDNDMEGKAGAYMLRLFGEPLTDELDEYKKLVRQRKVEECLAGSREVDCAAVGLVTAIACLIFLIMTFFNPEGRLQNALLCAGCGLVAFWSIKRSIHYGKLKSCVPEVAFFKSVE